MNNWSPLLATLTFLGALISATSPPQGELKELEIVAQRGGTVGQRMLALESIAKMQIPGEPPIEEVTLALSIGLRDSDSSVRIKTAKLLGPPQYLEVSVIQLTKATKTELKSWEKAWGALLKHADSGKKLTARLTSKWRSDPEGAQRDVDEYNAKVQELQGAIGVYEKVLTAYASTLSVLPDQRAADALVGVLKTSLQGKAMESKASVMIIDLQLPVIDALLTLGGRKALDITVEAMLAWDELAAERQSDEKQLEQDNVISNVEANLEWLRESIEKMHGHADAIADRLQKFAKANALPSTPGRSGSAKLWNSWTLKARPKLAKSLGRIPSTDEGLLRQ